MAKKNNNKTFLQKSWTFQPKMRTLLRDSKQEACSCSYLELMLAEFRIINKKTRQEWFTVPISRGMPG